MTRAEEFAQKEYPLGFSSAEILPWRMGLKEGYEQAEKDLGWTSVKDRLPEVGDIVLVHDKICCTMRLAQLCKSGNWIYRRETEYDYKVVTVDYWMPIPKIPEEK